jgi:hypothetical protein
MLGVFGGTDSVFMGLTGARSDEQEVGNTQSVKLWNALSLLLLLSLLSSSS